MKNFKSLTRFALSVALIAGMSGSAMAAENDAAFVISLKGTAQVTGERSFTVSPLTKLRMGEQVSLGKDSSIQIVYLYGNRKEEWSGGATFKVGSEKSDSSSKPIKIGSIPVAITNQIINTPESASTGRVGMVRLRAANDLKLQEIESKYQDYKETVGLGNTLAEVYKLGELYSLKKYDLMSDMLAQLHVDNPNNHEYAELISKYMLLLNEVKS